MPDEPLRPPGDDVPADRAPAAPAEGVVVRRDPAPVEAWRQRAVAALPQLARNPVVLGASAAVAGLAARAAVEVAVEVARRAVGVPPARRGPAVHVVHHVVHHVHHVVQHPAVPVVVRVPLLPPRL